MRFMLAIMLVSVLNFNPLVATNLAESLTNQPHCKISFVRVKQLKQKTAVRMLMPSSINDAAIALENEIKLMVSSNEKSPDQYLSECLTKLSTATIHEEAPPFLADNLPLILSLVRQSLEQQLKPPKVNEDNPIQMSDHFNNNHAFPHSEITSSYNGQSNRVLTSVLSESFDKRKNKTQEVKNNQPQDDNIKYMSEQIVSTRKSPIIGNIDYQDKNQTTSEQVGLLIPTPFSYDSPVNSGHLGLPLKKHSISNTLQFTTVNRPHSNHLESSKTKHLILNRIQDNHSRNYWFTNHPATVSNIDKHENSSLELISKLLDCFGNSWALMMLLIILAYWFSIRRNFLKTPRPIVSIVIPIYCNDNIKVLSMRQEEKLVA